MRTGVRDYMNIPSPLAVAIHERQGPRNPTTTILNKTLVGEKGETLDINVLSHCVDAVLQIIRDDVGLDARKSSSIHSSEDDT